MLTCSRRQLRSKEGSDCLVGSNRAAPTLRVSRIVSQDRSLEVVGERRLEEEGDRRLEGEGDRRFEEEGDRRLEEDGDRRLEEEEGDIKSESSLS
jgi:uncharacterized protein YciW